MVESPTKEDVKEALDRLGASIYGLKQGWSSPDLTRHIDLDVGVLTRWIAAKLTEEAELASSVAVWSAPAVTEEKNND